MGLCIYCMQSKPITAMKCPYCHERTGLLESTFWTVLHFVGKIVTVILLMVLLYQCTSAMGAEYPMGAEHPMEQTQQ